MLPDAWLASLDGFFVSPDAWFASLDGSRAPPDGCPVPPDRGYGPAESGITALKGRTV
jgi:hypothetical protein